MASVVELVCMVLVGILWGVTNPFLKTGSEGLEKIKKDSWILQLLEEMKFLVFNYKCLIPFLLNQCGSLLYYFTLASSVSRGKKTGSSKSAGAADGQDRSSTEGSAAGPSVLPTTSAEASGDGDAATLEGAGDVAAAGGEPAAVAGGDLSLAVPICNSLASVFTVGAGMALGEELGGTRAALGMTIATVGVTLCIIAAQ